MIDLLAYMKNSWTAFKLWNGRYKIGMWLIQETPQYIAKQTLKELKTDEQRCSSDTLERMVQGFCNQYNYNLYKEKRKVVWEMLEKDSDWFVEYVVQYVQYSICYGSINQCGLGENGEKRIKEYVQKCVMIYVNKK